jgi:hypothetical protein
MFVSSIRMHTSIINYSYKFNAFNVCGNENTSCIYSPGDNKIILKSPYFNLYLIFLISNYNNSNLLTFKKIFNFIIVLYVFKHRIFKKYHMEATYTKSTINV